MPTVNTATRHPLEQTTAHQRNPVGTNVPESFPPLKIPPLCPAFACRETTLRRRSSSRSATTAGSNARLARNGFYRRTPTRRARSAPAANGTRSSMATAGPRPNPTARTTPRSASWTTALCIGFCLRKKRPAWIEDRGVWAQHFGPRSHRRQLRRCRHCRRRRRRRRKGMACHRRREIRRSRWSRRRGCRRVRQGGRGGKCER